MVRFLPRRVVGASVAAVCGGATLAIVLTMSVSTDPADKLARRASPAAATGKLPAEPSADGRKGDTDRSKGEAADQAQLPSAHRPDPPLRNLDAERRPLVVARGAEPAVDDAHAREVYCSIDPTSYQQMIYDPETGEVDEDLLRDMMVLSDELYQHWQFAAFGRPGFESMLTLVYDTNRHWQHALDAVDSGRRGRSDQSLADAKAAMNKLEAALQRADVTCP